MDNRGERAADHQNHLRLGTRASDLAQWQARHVRDLLESHGVSSEIILIRTEGDRVQDVPLANLEGKGFFTKELEEALLADQVDIVVHSMKDLPTEMPAGLVLGALIGREDPRELLLARPEAVDPERFANDELLPLGQGARIGTSALRRRAQLLEHRPDLQVVDLRGNVPTRVRKLREEPYDAILIARAGVERLELDVEDLFVKALPLTELIPAPAQGMLAVQCREQGHALGILEGVHCAEAARAVVAERHLLALMDAGCHSPIGVNVSVETDGFRLLAFWEEEGRGPLRFDVRGPDPMELAESTYRAIVDDAEGGQK